MKFQVTISILLSFLVSLCGAVNAPDPGVPDTIKIEGGPLAVGVSRPLSVTFVNDELVGGYSLGLLCRTLDSGFAKFDSIVYLNRMADPTILMQRTVSPRGADGVSPDTFLLGATRDMGYPLPLGSSAVASLFFTGLKPGTMKVDSVYIPPAAPFILVDAGGSITFSPQYVSPIIEVQSGSQQPILTVPPEPFKIVAGALVEFSVQAQSPDNLPVTLSFVSMTLTDNINGLPSQTPSAATGNPLTFGWTSTANDIGIWTATFQACDSTGNCTVATVEIQVVESASYLMAFSINETTGVPKSFGITHGIFNAESNAELLLVGNEFHIYNYVQDQGWNSVLSMFTDFPTIAPQVGYFNGDTNLDAVMARFLDGPYHVSPFFGDGQKGFTVGGDDNDGHVTRSSAVGEFTGDNQLDYACTWYDGIYIYSGDGAGGFHLARMIPSSDSALSINSADFNGDGRADLAVGTTHGVDIYLNNGNGSFSLAHSYSQIYGVVDIEVTNRGSDFNNDNKYDLCISTPSVGGTQSQIVVYLGNGDGSFTPKVIRTVNGQIFGNSVGDFNGDGNLDIVYVNGPKKSVNILFGNGAGDFSNEIRNYLPHFSPRYTDCFDVDLDGDIDIVAYAAGMEYNNSLYTLVNQLNPPDYARQSLTFLAHDNATMELMSKSRKVLSQMRNSMPTGEYYNKNLDQDDLIDDIAQVSLVENGAYTLKASPKPNLPPGQTFSLEYTSGGKTYCIARNVSMASSGYSFGLFPDGTPGVNPKSGAYVQGNPPAFIWQGSGQYDFQLASDPEFKTILVNTVVSGNAYSLETQLAGADTITYYWRIKHNTDSQFGDIYAVNVVPGTETSCGDLNKDTFVNIGDIVYLINGIFKNGPSSEPFSSSDINCDGRVNVGDAVHMINYIFKGGVEPCCSQ